MCKLKVLYRKLEKVSSFCVKLKNLQKFMKKMRKNALTSEIFNQISSIIYQNMRNLVLRHKASINNR